MSNSTALTRLLSTNELPTTLEAATLQAEIDTYQGLISQFEEQVRRRRGVLSVVRRLPGEILGEIFKHALSPYPLNSHTRQNLINFNCVCKNWRQAALMCHQLWDRVYVAENEISFVPIQSWMARSGALPKALHVVVPGRKWDESWQESEDEDEMDEEADDEDSDETDGQGGMGGDKGGDEHKEAKIPESIRQVIWLLTRGVPIDKLGLECSNADDLKYLLRFLPTGGSKALSKLCRWNRINSLDLSFREGCLWDDPDGSSLEYFLPFFSDNITSFELQLPDSDCTPPSDIRLEEPGFMGLPRSFAEKLRSFTISCDWGVQHMFILLEHCTNLEVLTLDFLRLSQECELTAEQYTLEIGGLPEVTLPKLHTLRLRECPPDVISVLGSLNTPAMINLDIEFESETGLYTTAEDLSQFLTTESSCAPTLKSLRLVDVKLDATDFVQVLDELPALTHLVLAGVGFDEDSNDLFKELEERCEPPAPYLTRRADLPEPFLPDLQVLELFGLVNEQNFDHLVGFIDSRERSLRMQALKPVAGSGDGRLKELIVGYDRGSSLDFRSPQRQTLMKKGRNVNIHPWAAGYR